MTNVSRQYASLGAGRLTLEERPLPKHIVVIELEASQTDFEDFIGRIEVMAAELGCEVRIESFPIEGSPTSHGEALLHALTGLDEMVAEDRAEYARKIKPGDQVLFWDDDKGFFEGRVKRIDNESGLRAFAIEGRKKRLHSEDIYRPLTVHDARLWAVQAGDELEWYCPTAVERSMSEVVRPHCPDSDKSACPGGLWHHGRVERVFHEGFDAPCFQVEGCSRRLGEPAFQIRVRSLTEQAR